MGMKWTIINKANSYMFVHVFLFIQVKTYLRYILGLLDCRVYVFSTISTHTPYSNNQNILSAIPLNNVLLWPHFTTSTVVTLVQSPSLDKSLQWPLTGLSTSIPHSTVHPHTAASKILLKFNSDPITFLLRTLKGLDFIWSKRQRLYDDLQVVVTTQSCFLSFFFFFPCSTWEETFWHLHPPPSQLRV